jgi:hypothetical protein
VIKEKKGSVSEVTLGDLMEDVANYLQYAINNMQEHSPSQTGDKQFQSLMKVNVSIYESPILGKQVMTSLYMP